MTLYHMSQSLQQGDTLTPDFQRSTELVQPFIQALEKSEDFFYGMILNGKYMFAVLDRSGLREWADYAKWATEGAFEYIRKAEFPGSYSRLASNYFYDNLPDCKKLYDYDWGGESEEEQKKVHLFEVEVADETPQKRDMNIYDEAYDAMCTSQDISFVLDCARRYFAEEQTEHPVWEILSPKTAKAVNDVSMYLRNEDSRHSTEHP